MGGVLAVAISGGVTSATDPLVQRERIKDRHCCSLLIGSCVACALVVCVSFVLLLYIELVFDIGAGGAEEVAKDGPRQLQLQLLSLPDNRL